MRLATGLLAALAAQALAGTNDDFAARQNEYHERIALARAKSLFNNGSRAEIQASSSPPRYLTAKTKKFAVNGSALPFVQFDIGESYSGLMPIDDNGRALFFWFFPTQSGSEKDITIWLNGGPGCSSLRGFFQENGPVLWQPGTYGPQPNEYALNKLSNVLYVEQPVGTGFLQGKPNEKNEVQVGKQFDGFWRNFIDTFDLHYYGIYITGESYAGMYVPYIGEAFLDAGGKKYHNLKGILIYDPFIGPEELILPAAIPFMKYNSPNFPFTAEGLESLDALQEECGFNDFMEKGLTFPPNGPLPKVNLSSQCDTYEFILNEALQLNLCFDIYHVSQTCPRPADILKGGGRVSYRLPSLDEAYFNRADVKSVIHAPLDVEWSDCNGGLLQNDHSPPSGSQNGPIMRIVEATGNVIVGHATQDFYFISNQTLLTLNDLVWNGKRGFDQAPNYPFIIPQNMLQANPYLQMGKWTRSRNLTFVEINLAGHMVPAINPRADFRINEVLMGRVSDLSAKVPFSV